MKLVIEIMPKGDLLHHLISLRPVYMCSYICILFYNNMILIFLLLFTLLLIREGPSQCKELGALLLSYTRQIALGMAYLSIKEYVHRDLAARNVLVSDDGVCKVYILYLRSITALLCIHLYTDR